MTRPLSSAWTLRVYLRPPTARSWAPPLEQSPDRRSPGSPSCLDRRGIQFYDNSPDPSGWLTPGPSGRGVHCPGLLLTPHGDARVDADIRHRLLPLMGMADK